MIVDNYASAIKELRIKMNLSQQGMAQLLGVSFSSINRWENSVHEPTLKVKRKLRSLFVEYDIKIN